jgi:hypothetical protein
VSDPRTHDVRRLVAEIKSALDSYPKEALAEILTYVFKVYVVEGPLPLAASAGTLLEARPELEGQSFAQVVAWLQLHLDLPELSLFEVDGERVSVRIGGRLMPLEAAASRPEPLPPARAAVAPTPAAPAPAPAAPPTAGAAPASSAAARPMPVTPTPPVATRPAAAAPTGATPPQPATPQQREESGDASSRFALLEVDD